MREDGRSEGNIVLMDIDGVLCPIGEIPSRFDRISFPENRFVSWTMRTDVADLISDLVLDPGVRLVWASAWQKDSGIIPEALGLPECEYIDFDDVPADPSRWWKIPAIEKFLEGEVGMIIGNGPHPPRNGRPVLWIDDDLVTAGQQVARENNVDWIRPDPSEGLTEDLIDRIRRWCASDTSSRVDNGGR